MIRLAVILIVAFFSCIGPATGANPTQEIEPNDTLATATPIVLGEGTVKGHLSGGIDPDHFIFTSLAGGETLSVTQVIFLGGPSWAVATLLTRGGQVLGTYDVTGIQPVAISLPSTGNTYVLKLERKSPAFGEMDYIVASTAPTEVSTPSCALDVDGNGKVDALTDILILMRAAFGITGNAAVIGAIGVGAQRTTWPQIRDFLNTNCGTHFAL